MEKRKIRFVPVCLICLLLVFSVVTGFTAYAWFSRGDRIDNSRYSIIKLNSSVTLYRAQDSNYNGVADPAPLAEHVTTYYTERFSFTQVGDVNYAMSQDPTGQLDMIIDIDDMLPSRIYTYKFAMINHGEAETEINAMMQNMGSLTGVSDAQKDLISTLSLRVVSLRKSTSAAVDPLFELKDKIYLCDYMKNETLSEDIMICGDESIGDIFQSETYDNCFDFLLLVEMEPYDVLSLKTDAFSMTQAEYNALYEGTGTTVTLPLIRIYFELVYSDPSAG